MIDYSNEAATINHQELSHLSPVPISAMHDLDSSARGEAHDCIYIYTECHVVVTWRKELLRATN